MKQGCGLIRVLCLVLVFSMTAACATTPVTEGTPEQKVGWVGNTPYAAMPELESVTNGTNAYVYWRIARLFALCELENFRDDNGWTDMKISERPVLVYDALSHPKYYEYRVLNGGTECGAIVCIAQKKDGEPTAYVLRYAPDYSGLLDYPANYRVVADGYPKVGYAPVDGVYAAKGGVRMFEEDGVVMITNERGHWITNITNYYINGYDELQTNAYLAYESISDSNYYWMTNISQINFNPDVWETNIYRVPTRWITNVNLVSSDPDVWETNYQFMNERFIDIEKWYTDISTVWNNGEFIIETNFNWIVDALEIKEYVFNDYSVTNYEMDPLELALQHPEYFTNFNVTPEMVEKAANQIVVSNQVKWDLVDEYFTNLIYYSTNDELVHQKYLQAKTRDAKYDGGTVVYRFVNDKFKWWNSDVVLDYLGWRKVGYLKNNPKKTPWCSPSAAAMLLTYYGYTKNILSKYTITNKSPTLPKNTSKYSQTFSFSAGGWNMSPKSRFTNRYVLTVLDGTYLEILKINSITIDYLSSSENAKCVSIKSNRSGNDYIIEIVSERSAASYSGISANCNININFFAKRYGERSYGDIVDKNNRYKIYPVGYTNAYRLIETDAYANFYRMMGYTDMEQTHGVWPEQKIADAMNTASVTKEFVYYSKDIFNASDEGNTSELWKLIKSLVTLNRPFLLIRGGGVRDISKELGVFASEGHNRVGFGYKTTFGTIVKTVWLWGFIPNGAKDYGENIHWVLLTDGNGYEFQKETTNAANKIRVFRKYNDYTFWERINWSSDKTCLPAQNYGIIFNKDR